MNETKSHDSPAASKPVGGEKEEINELENARTFEEAGTPAQDYEKDGLPAEGDGAENDGARHKFTFKLFLSLTAMAFLWVGSQIPLYLFGSVLAVIYTDIGGADRWVWFVIGYLIPNAAICPFVGALSDLFGRRIVGIVGQICLIVGPVITSTANTMNICIAGSVISGFGAGLNELVALSGTAELVPARLRGIYVAGLVFTILPFVAATLYAQLIAAAVSWRYVGIMVAGWNLIGLILVAAVYKPPPRVNSQGFSRSEILRRVDYVGGLLSTGGVMCFMMGMQWGATQYQWTSVHVLVPFFIGIALIVAFFVWEVKLAPYPMVPPRMFTKSKRTMIITLFITFLSGSNYFVLLLLWPTENYNIYGYDPVAIGLRTLPIGIGILLGSFIALVLISVTKGRITELMIFWTALMTAGTGSMSIATTQNSNAMYGLVFIAGLGIGGVIIPCSIIAQLVCPDDLIGTITAITLAIRYVGGAIGFAVYDNVLYHKFLESSTEIVAVKTIIGEGLVNYTTPSAELLVADLVTLAANAEFAQLKQVIATDPLVIGKNAFPLIVAATQEAWALAYRWPYWISIAWGGVCFVLSFFLGDIRRFLDSHVAVAI